MKRYANPTAGVFARVTAIRNMEKPMDIRAGLYIWVTKVEYNTDETILDGLCFDGEYGFGEDGVRYYSGDIYVIANDYRRSHVGIFSTTHISRRGTIWSTNLRELPAEPFLITKNADLRGPLDLKIDLIPSEAAADVFSRDREASYPVTIGDSIGILRHSQENYLLTYYYLSYHDDITLSTIRFAEWNIDAGTISNKINSI